MRHNSIQLYTVFALLLGLVCWITPEKSFAQDEKPILFAMTAAFVTDAGAAVYEEIAAYVQEKSGLKTDFITNLSYSTVNAMVEAGAVDVAFICGYPYVLAHDGKEIPPVRLIAAPVMQAPLYQGKPVYYSYVITRKGSKLDTFEDLRGKRFVYNDKISNSGYNMPRAHLIELGETNGFFGDVLHSGSHEESIRMVAAGEADASAVDSLVLDYARHNKENYADDVHIIEKLGPAGIPPVVVSKNLPAGTAEKIKNVLLHMHEDAEGKIILNKALVQQFVAVGETVYDDVRHMHKMAVDAGFTVIK